MISPCTLPTVASSARASNHRQLQASVWPLPLSQAPSVTSLVGTLLVPWSLILGHVLAAALLATGDKALPFSGGFSGRRA